MDQACEHCGQPLGDNRECWWCRQAAGDECLSKTVDAWWQIGENAPAFIPLWLQRAKAENGVFF